MYSGTSKTFGTPKLFHKYNLKSGELSRKANKDIKIILFEKLH